jgi:hypothetical protein
VLPKHSIIIAVSANFTDKDVGEAYATLVRTVVSAVQSSGPINRSAADANKLAEQLRVPFSGKPGNSPSRQDVPQPPK